MEEYENKKGFKVKEYDSTLNLVDCLDNKVDNFLNEFNNEEKGDWND